MMVLLEFTVEGPPLSHQTRDRSKLQAWRDTVRAAATRAWTAQFPATRALRVVVAYFHDGPAVLIDNDNMLKPIQDALNGLAYVDDRQITHADVRKYDLNGTFRIRGVSQVLLKAFSAGREFLYIKVEAAPDPSVLPR